MLKEYNGNGYIFDSACDYKNLIIRVNPEAKDLVKVMENCYADKFLVTQICKNCEIPDEDGVQETNEETDDIIVMFDLKKASTEQKIEALKYGFNNINLDDPLMQLNIYNLVKSYNNLNDEFFNSPDVYFKDVEELLDVKLALGANIKSFIKQLSIYFLSLLKSYTKFVYTPSDEHIELPTLYKNMILSSDMSTLSGIFAKAPEFSTNELMYIDNAYIYMTTLLSKSKVGIDLMEDFFNDLANSTNEEVSE